MNNQWTSPKKAALIEHTKRAAYQAGHVWGQMLVADPDLLVLLQTLSWKKRIKQLDGMYSDVRCKLFLLTGNSCTMGARKDAENNASVTRLHSVYVMASALKINIMLNK